ncbi:MAG: hypothetical protein ACXVRW_18210 [Solirubrobacteraceae bacterium]
MTLQNDRELAEVLAEQSRLGKVFARHAYGMRRWVDIFAARIPAAGPDEKQLIAQLVADNARHMNLFRARARAHGVDPDAYVCPPEGEVIYERIEQMEGTDGPVGYALGSLDHFEQLLGVYRAAADGADAAAIDTVRGDVAGMRETLRPMVTSAAARARMDEAHELYRVRELAETAMYAR